MSIEKIVAAAEAEHLKWVEAELALENKGDDDDEDEEEEDEEAHDPVEVDEDDEVKFTEEDGAEVLSELKEEKKKPSSGVAKKPAALVSALFSDYKRRCRFCDKTAKKVDLFKWPIGHEASTAFQYCCFGCRDSVFDKVKQESAGDGLETEDYKVFFVSRGAWKQHLGNIDKKETFCSGVQCCICWRDEKDLKELNVFFKKRATQAGKKFEEEPLRLGYWPAYQTKGSDLKTSYRRCCECCWILMAEGRIELELFGKTKKGSLRRLGQMSNTKNGITAKIAWTLEAWNAYAEAKKSAPPKPRQRSKANSGKEEKKDKSVAEKTGDAIRGKIKKRKPDAEPEERSEKKGPAASAPSSSSSSSPSVKDDRLFNELKTLCVAFGAYSCTSTPFRSPVLLSILGTCSAKALCCQCILQELQDGVQKLPLRFALSWIRTELKRLYTLLYSKEKDLRQAGFGSPWDKCLAMYQEMRAEKFMDAKTAVELIGQLNKVFNTFCTIMYEAPFPDVTARFQGERVMEFETHPFHCHQAKPMTGPCCHYPSLVDSDRIICLRHLYAAFDFELQTLEQEQYMPSTRTKQEAALLVKRLCTQSERTLAAVMDARKTVLMRIPPVLAKR